MSGVLDDPINIDGAESESEIAGASREDGRADAMRIRPTFCPTTRQQLDLGKRSRGGDLAPPRDPRELSPSSVALFERQQLLLVSSGVGKPPIRVARMQDFPGNARAVPLSYDANDNPGISEITKLLTMEAANVFQNPAALEAMRAIGARLARFANQGGAGGKHVRTMVGAGWQGIMGSLTAELEVRDPATVISHKSPVLSQVVRFHMLTHDLGLVAHTSPSRLPRTAFRTTALSRVHGDGERCPLSRPCLAARDGLHRLSC